MLTPDQISFARLRLLDGGLATELEQLGASIDGPLWSAHVLEQQPEIVVAAHEAYLEAGADVILTASYQVSRRGYAELGLPPELADRALLRAVDLALQARHRTGSHALVAASLGPYGATLHNGAEYHGNYAVSPGQLAAFHRERIAVLAPSAADLLAFETVPSLAEAQAILKALADFPALPAWITFTCSSDRTTGAGDSVEECMELVSTQPQIVATGLNCTRPALVAPLLERMSRHTRQPLLAYPNSGESWDAEARQWRSHNPHGSQPAAEADAWAAGAPLWLAAGACCVGGCCRTGPAHIRALRRLLGRV